MPRRLTRETSQGTLKKAAKRWLKLLRAGEPDARARLENAYPGAPETPVLRHVQHALARECGFESWIALMDAVQERSREGKALPGSWTPEECEKLARDWILAFGRDPEALARLNAKYRRSFTYQDLWAEVWRRVYAFRQRSFQGTETRLLLEEARTLISRDAGFSSWKSLTQAEERSIPRVPPYAIDGQEGKITPRRRLDDKEWDELLAVMKERRIPALDANGLMTDAVLARLAKLKHVTRLSLGGSRELTDDGLLRLAGMPQLEYLNLDEYPGGKLTDRGLEVLRHLPRLRVFAMTWQRGITDSGAAQLRHCDSLEQVDLMGSPTGDGAIAALAGMPRLRSLKSGRLVTDQGLELLQEIPLLSERRHHGGDSRGAELLIDGPFTDQGLVNLAGLAGLAALDLFWNVKRITSRGFVHLISLPHLESLGADGDLTDDVAMGHIAAMPRLRKLRAQGTPASDEGWEALARSGTLESIWARDCKRLGGRGFVALSKMPALRGLGLHCHKVGDRALATLPLFPALRELTPMGVKDAGFVHVGRCERLERLTCMYCRKTTDKATGHVAGLRQLKHYYAGSTQITDRSLEILSGMASLEEVELYECTRVTDAGLEFLAGLPRLRKVQLEALPGVTLAGTRVFPQRVRVVYST